MNTNDKNTLIDIVADNLKNNVRCRVIEVLRIAEALSSLRNEYDLQDASIFETLLLKLQIEIEEHLIATVSTTLRAALDVDLRKKRMKEKVMRICKHLKTSK